MNILHRPRRLRQSPSFRDISSETHLHPSQFILPVFVCNGKGVKKENPSLPSALSLSIDELIPFVEKAYEKGIRSTLLFGIAEKRDSKATEALQPGCAVVKAIEAIRKHIPDMIVTTDIALDPYTDHGHDGLFVDGKVPNDDTVSILADMSVLHAEAGAQVVAPSDMMDGRVSEIRHRLDQKGLTDTAILSYTAKYASAFYGPFRDSLGGELVGDKKSYQMNPLNRREALRELELDLDEGADIVMVKPAGHYLDVLSDVKARSLVPVAAYHVSGEAALIELGAKHGLFERDQALLEVTSSIARAGADLIATYFALELCDLIRQRS